MVPIRFTSLVLGLLFVMHTLRDSSANAHQGRETNGNGFAATGENVVTVQKELLDGIPAAATRKIGLGGRKMVVDKVSRKEIEKEEGLSISGKDNNASKKSFRRSQNQLNDQNKINMLEQKTILKSASCLGISKSETVHPPNTSSHHSQDSKVVSTKASSEYCSSSRSDKPAVSFQETQKDESQRLLEAANEIMNLMHKDYVGMGTKPPRKPPINNHEPSN